MRNFILGIVFTVLILLIGGLGLALLGFLPVRANQTPPRLESHIAMSAVDNSVERHALRLNNPIPLTDENLLAGLNLYNTNCALCHGGLDRQPSILEKSFYPPPPNLILNPPDDAEWHLFYVIHNGIRYSGMPAWDRALSDAEIWKVTAFLARLDKLPPGVQDYWKKSSGAGKPAPETVQHSH